MWRVSRSWRKNSIGGGSKPMSQRKNSKLYSSSFWHLGKRRERRKTN